MTIASTGGMASGPSAGRRPSMAAPASGRVGVAEVGERGQGPAAGAAGVIFSKNRSSSTGTGMTSVLFFSPATCHGPSPVTNLPRPEDHLPGKVFRPAGPGRSRHARPGIRAAARMGTNGLSRVRGAASAMSTPGDDRAGHALLR
jgi:hypothetical protein